MSAERRAPASGEPNLHSASEREALARGTSAYPTASGRQAPASGGPTPPRCERCNCCEGGYHLSFASVRRALARDGIPSFIAGGRSTPASTGLVCPSVRCRIVVGIRTVLPLPQLPDLFLVTWIPLPESVSETNTSRWLALGRMSSLMGRVILTVPLATTRSMSLLARRQSATGTCHLTRVMVAL